MSAAAIINNQTRELVASLEQCPPDNAQEADTRTWQLVDHLTDQLAQPEVRQRYEEYRLVDGVLGQYPVDSEGFAESFDILDQEADFYEHWTRHGVVVGATVASETLCANAIGRIKSMILELSDGTCDIDDPDTYPNLPVDAAGEPILTRGFFEIYHDDSLAQLRQTIRNYLQQVVIWGRADIWTTFDRYGVKLPGHQESVALPLHVDQNPNQSPGFHTVQGVLALDDCPVERGTLVTVPGSKALFPTYAWMTDSHGEYVELDTNTRAGEILAERAQALPLKQGDLVNWDSRTTHANTTNTSTQTRFMALIAGGPAREDDPAAGAARAEAFETGEGSNVRKALMHASKRPRYTDGAVVRQIRQPEILTPLGKLIYGQEAYGAR